LAASGSSPANPRVASMSEGDEVGNLPFLPLSGVPFHSPVIQDRPLVQELTVSSCLGSGALPCCILVIIPRSPFPSCRYIYTGFPSSPPRYRPWAARSGRWTHGAPCSLASHQTRVSGSAKEAESSEVHRSQQARTTRIRRQHLPGDMGFHRAQERRLPEPPQGDHRVALGEGEGVVDEPGELPPPDPRSMGALSSCPP